MEWFFLLSGLFLGWSLGANDAANIFGTAVGTRMISFRKAAFIASLFVILGAVISGAGPAHTYGKLGSINALGGAFIVALSAGLTVLWMTKLGLPVSTSHGIVGAIVGWDIFAGVMVDTGVLTRIVLTWIVSPFLAAFISFIIFKIMKRLLPRLKIHLLTMDMYTRLALILIGAFGAYSLGANNIANVMGVFVKSNPFKDITLFSFFRISSVQILFFIGGLAISLGIFTYSRRVMNTVGREIFKMTPLAAWIVVFAESLVLFVFASSSLKNLLISLGLPSIPLVPVSSSQLVVGGVIGVGIARGGGRAINYKKLLRILWGWIITPVTAGILSFFLLFFMQNVFQQKVFQPVPHVITHRLINKLSSEGMDVKKLERLEDKIFYRETEMASLLKREGVNNKTIRKIVHYSEVDSIRVDTLKLMELLKKNKEFFTEQDVEDIKKLHGKIFIHSWELMEELSSISDSWKMKEKNSHNKRLKEKYNLLLSIFRI